MSTSSAFGTTAGTTLRGSPGIHIDHRDTQGRRLILHKLRQLIRQRQRPAVKVSPLRSSLLGSLAYAAQLLQHDHWLGVACRKGYAISLETSWLTSRW